MANPFGNQRRLNVPIKRSSFKLSALQKPNPFQVMQARENMRMMAEERQPELAAKTEVAKQRSESETPEDVRFRKYTAEDIRTIGMSEAFGRHKDFILSKM